MRFNGIVNNKVLAVFNRCTMARDNFCRRIPLQIREAVSVAVSDVGRQCSFFSRHFFSLLLPSAISAVIFHRVDNPKDRFSPLGTRRLRALSLNRCIRATSNSCYINRVQKDLPLVLSLSLSASCLSSQPIGAVWRDCIIAHLSTF